MEKYLQILSKNIKTLAKEFKLSQTDFLEECDVNRSFISNMKKSMPTIDKLLNISKYTNISIDYLLGLSDVKEIITSDQLRQNIPPEDKQILDQYYNLTPNNKSIVDYIFGMEEEEVEPTKIYHFPVFFQSAAAGIGQLSDPSIYKMEEFELQSIPNKFAFGMYIEGDSMKDDILDNDIVLIDPIITQPGELNDEVVVALFGEELICKRLSVNSFERSYDFNSDNPSKEEESRKNQKQSDFKIVGKVVGVIHR